MGKPELYLLGRAKESVMALVVTGVTTSMGDCFLLEVDAQSPDQLACGCLLLKI